MLFEAVAAPREELKHAGILLSTFGGLAEYLGREDYFEGFLLIYAFVLG